jgi:hypothetical protein
MRDEDLPLLEGQFIEGLLQSLEDCLPGELRFRAGIARGQQKMQVLGIAVLAECLRLLFAESIDDAITRDAEQPAADLLDRLRQAIGLHELEKHFLQDVFRIG